MILLDTMGFIEHKCGKEKGRCFECLRLFNCHRCLGLHIYCSWKYKDMKHSYLTKSWILFPELQSQTRTC